MRPLRFAWNFYPHRNPPVAVHAGMKANLSPALIRAGLGLGILSLLAGCANSPSWGAWSKRPTDAEIAAVLARTAEPQAVSQQPPAEARPDTLVAATTER